MHRLVVLAAISVSLFGVNCTEASTTQLVVLMDTDYPVPEAVDRIHARVAKTSESGGDEIETWSRTFSVSNEGSTNGDAYSLPATFSVVPVEADIDREIVVELQALGTGTDRVLATRRVRTGFIRGQARLLRLLVYQACAELSCSAGETCGCPEGTSCATPSCVDERVRPEALEIIDDPGVLPPDSEFPVGGDDGGVPPDDGGTGCDPPLVVCDLECVDTQSDARYCGDCDTTCPSGFVCDSAVCTDLGDCRTNDTGCSGFTYCDETTGDCLRGCSDDDQCTRNQEMCDVAAHECVCTPGFERCAFDCVDTESDPRFCGNCLTFCPLGEVCESGVCFDPGDCRTNDTGCSGFTYCDETTGNCLVGCDEDMQCTGRDQVCDTGVHECVCAPDFHECAGACVSNLSPETCGALCTPCPAPPNATPTCEVGICDFVCNEDFERCDDACCPTSCPPGEVLFEQACETSHVRTVDDRGDNGQYTSVALDGAGLPRIAYYARSGRNLRYSFLRPNGIWSQEAASEAGDVGKHASLALDLAGNPWIAHYDAGDKVARASNRDAGGDWATRIIGLVNDVGEYTSLAIDPSGAPYVAYYAKPDKDLYFAARLSIGIWVPQVADSEGDVGKHASLAFDARGVAHIAYYDEGNKDLLLATREGSTWGVEVIDAQLDVGEYASLAFDAAGTAHVSYYDETNKDLKLATRQTNGSWVAETVDSIGDVGRYTSLAFDAAGAAHISYYDETSRDLKHAVRKPGETWVLQTIDSTGDVGEFTSIAIDGDGHAHISYYDSTNKNLKYAIVAAPE